MTLLVHPAINVLDAVWMMQFSAEWYTVLPSVTVIFINPLQPPNAELLMLVTLSGIVMLVRLLQSENA